MARSWKPILSPLILAFLIAFAAYGVAAMFFPRELRELQLRGLRPGGPVGPLGHGWLRSRYFIPALRVLVGAVTALSPALPAALIAGALALGP